MNIRWGTPTPLQIEDAKYRIMIPVRMFGQFAIQVAESKKLLIKLVGTTREFNQKTLSDCFKGILLTNIRDYVAKMFVQKEISILEIQSYLKEISNAIADDLRAEFTEYGLELVNFNVNEISVPENDPAYLELRKAKSERAKMDILGYNYQQERMFNVLDRAASNEGTSSAVMGAGMGLGMGLNVGNAVGGAMNEAINDNIKPQNNEQEKPEQPHEDNGIVCENCGAKLPEGAKFCLGCGQKIVPKGKKICPSCNAELPEEAKFCFVCCEKLEKTCSKCGAVIQPGAKFCLECGEKVQ